MAALTFDALLRGLKKSPPAAAYLLHGDEDVLKHEAIAAILAAAVEPAARDFNLDTRFAGDLDVERFHSLVHTLPLLAERRAVVIRGVEVLGKRKSKLRDEVLRYLQQPNPSTVLVLVLSAGEEPDADIARHVTPVAPEPLAPERVIRWVAHYAGQIRLSIAPDAAELLIAAAGADLGTLAREMEKLAGLGRDVTAGDVTALVGARRGETAYDLVAAALERRAAAAAQLVEPVLEQSGMTGVRIVTLLGTHLVGMALARGERDRGIAPGRLADTIYQVLRVSRPYGLRSYKEEGARWAAWSERWTAAELREALRAALAADVALKTSTVTDDRGIVTQLVLGFAAFRRAAA